MVLTNSEQWMVRLALLAAVLSPCGMVAAEESVASRLEALSDAALADGVYVVQSELLSARAGSDIDLGAVRLDQLSTGGRRLSALEVLDAELDYSTYIIAADPVDGTYAALLSGPSGRRGSSAPGALFDKKSSRTRAPGSLDLRSRFDALGFDLPDLPEGPGVESIGAGGEIPIDPPPNCGEPPVTCPFTCSGAAYILVEHLDPFFLQLAYTQANLQWSRGGGQACRERIFGTANCVARSPTAAGTHWSVLSCQGGQLLPSNSLHGYIARVGEYVNWDFGDPSASTRVRHTVSLEHWSSQPVVFWSIEDWGEYSSIIFARIHRSSHNNC